MQTKQKKRGLLSVILPFLIDYAVSMVIQIIVVMKLMLPEIPKMVQSVPTDNPQDAMQKIMETYMPKLLEEYISYIPLVTIIVALAVIPAFVMMYRNDIRYEHEQGVLPREKTPFSKYVVIAGIAVPLAVAATNLLTLSNLTVSSEAFRAVSTNLYSINFGLQLLGYGLIVPIAEELMFRGLVYKRLAFMNGKKAAMLFSALIFGLYHGNLPQGIYGFVVGLVSVYLYEKYGSIKAPILLHASMNITSVVATQYKMFNWIFHDMVRVAVVTVLCAAVGSGMFVLMQRMFPEKAENENQDENNQDVSSI